MAEEITNYKLIPCYNRKKEFIDNIIVSNEDYDRVTKYKWTINISKQVNGEYKYASTQINGKSIRLSHFIKGKPKNGNVIDHINNNAIDNTRENLHEIPRSHNSQNKKKIITEKTTSKYLGVSFETHTNKWCCQSSGFNLGRFTSEIEAAKTYDKFVYVKYGKNASTNNLIKFEDTINLTLDDIIPKKTLKNKDSNDNELPLYINFRKKKFIIQRTYNKIKFSSTHSTLEDAKKQLEFYNKKIQEMKGDEEKEFNNKEITRNSDGFAIINIYNKNKKELTGEVIVDDDKWYELSKISWYFKNDKKYVVGYVNGKNITMHRYLMNAPEGIPIDHKNQNGLDNRICNLRPITDSANSHNRKKKANSLSIYKGVYPQKHNKSNPYLAKLIKDGKKYHLGYYNNELQAAYAYNLKAYELFGDFALLNEINIDEETINKWKEEIYNKWKKKNEKNI
jgi:hypothetical protein